MRIAICCDRAEYFGGGVDRTNFELAKALVKLNHRVIFVYKFGNKSKIPNTESYKIKGLKIPFSSGLIYCLKLPGILNKIKPDLVVTQLSTAPLLGKIKQKHCHIIYNLELLELLHADINYGLITERPLIIWCELFNSLKADRVFGINGGLVKQISNFYRISAKLINLGVDLKKFRPAPKRKNKIPQIICVFRGDRRRKNVDLLIKVVKDMPIQLKITNSPNIKLSNNIMNLNYLPEKQLIKELQQSDLFILPSKQESFGLATLEALACNLPVVITKTGIWKEVARAKAGEIIEPTIKGIKNGIERALKTDYSQKPRQLAEQYNWENAAKAIIKTDRKHNRH